MRKLFLIAISFATATAFGQGKTLYSVSMVEAKMGQSAAFERAWKAHILKFHNGEDKRNVEEIVTGSNSGNLLLFSGPSSIADMDIEKASQPAHDADYDGTVVPSVSTFSKMGTYRWVDTLSYNGKVTATKYTTTVYHVKPGRAPELAAEIKRGLMVNQKIKSAASYNTFIKLWPGSDPVIVVSNNLKDGFKQIDNTYPEMKMMTDNFKTAYIQEYGQSMWDNRAKLIPELCNSWETYLSKDRKDMSSVTK